MGDFQGWVIKDKTSIWLSVMGVFALRTQMPCCEEAKGQLDRPGVGVPIRPVDINSRQVCEVLDNPALSFRLPQRTPSGAEMSCPCLNCIIVRQN